MVAGPQSGPADDPALGQHALQQTTDVSNLYKNTFVWNPRQQPGAALGANHRKAYDQFFNAAEAPGLYVAEHHLIDIHSGEEVQNKITVATDGKKAVEINLDEAARLHEDLNSPASCSIRSSPSSSTLGDAQYKCTEGSNIGHVSQNQRRVKLLRHVATR